MIKSNLLKGAELTKEQFESILLYYFPGAKASYNNKKDFQNEKMESKNGINVTPTPIRSNLTTITNPSDISNGLYCKAKFGISNDKELKERIDLPNLQIQITSKGKYSFIEVPVKYEKRKCSCDCRKADGSVDISKNDKMSGKWCVDEEHTNLQVADDKGNKLSDDDPKQIENNKVKWHKWDDIPS